MSYNTDAATLNGQQPSFYNGSQLPAPVTKTANYTVLATDCVIIANATAGAFTLTLPSTGITAGKVYYIKQKALSANTITVSVSGGGTIDGAASLILNSLVSLLDYQLVFDGNNYFII
jgi:hypothetical protein